MLRPSTFTPTSKLLPDRLNDLMPAPAAPALKRRRLAPLLASILVCVLLAALAGRLLLLSEGQVDFHRYRLSPVATSGIFEGEPAWSRDGRNIAYTADVGHVRQIFVRSRSAYAAAQITRSSRTAANPSGRWTALKYCTFRAMKPACRRCGLWGPVAERHNA